MIIYKITFPNNKIYIGQTIQKIKERIYGHIYYALHKKDQSRYNPYGSKIGNAFRKYSKDYRVEIIDSASSIDELNQKEIFWIKYFNSTDDNVGYNIQSGGENNKHADSTKNMISQSNKDKWSNPELAKRMLEGLKKGTQSAKLSQTGVERVNRVAKKCNLCGKTFLSREKEDKKFCSSRCAAKYASTIGSKAIHKEYLIKKEELISIIYKWAKENKELILNCPYNKISKINSLLEYCNVKDWRTLTSAMGVNGRKDLLKNLKEYLS